MKFWVVTIALLTLLATFASASVIPAEYTEQKCGNGIRDGYELCEPDTAFDICPAIGKLLKIAMVCDERNCACLPGESAKACGNELLEGAEMCDPGEKEEVVDWCGNISAAIGLPLKCDTDICDCVPEGLVFKPSTCGDELVEGYEDCETDDDCPRGRVCNECTCEREQNDLNLTPVEYNVTTDDIPIHTIEDIIRRDKQKIANFVLEDYVGEIIPEDLEYFDDEVINVFIRFSDGSNKTVGIVTTQTVVQEIHPYPMNKSTMKMWIDEASLNKIRESTERTKTIVELLEDDSIEYKPRGFFRRIWFWLFRPF